MSTVIIYLYIYYRYIFIRGYAETFLGLKVSRMLRYRSRVVNSLKNLRTAAISVPII